MRRLVRRRVVINTKTERAFIGVLWSRLFGIWVLKDAKMLKESGQQVPLDGEVVVLKRDIDFVQVLP
jgi:hypothetical protein